MITPMDNPLGLALLLRAASYSVEQQVDDPNVRPSKKSYLQGLLTTMVATQDRLVGHPIRRDDVTV